MPSRTPVCQGVKMRTDRHLVSHFLEVNAAHQVHLAVVDLQDVESGALVRVGELDLAVNPARSQQCCIQNVYPVGCHQTCSSRETRYEEDNRQCCVQNVYPIGCFQNLHQQKQRGMKPAETSRKQKVSEEGNMQCKLQCSLCAPDFWGTSRMSIILVAIRTCISRQKRTRGR